MATAVAGRDAPPCRLPPYEKPTREPSDKTPPPNHAAATPPTDAKGRIQPGLAQLNERKSAVHRPGCRAWTAPRGPRGGCGRPPAPRPRPRMGRPSDPMRARASRTVLPRSRPRTSESRRCAARPPRATTFGCWRDEDVGKVAQGDGHALQRLDGQRAQRREVVAHGGGAPHHHVHHLGGRAPRPSHPGKRRDARRTSPGVSPSVLAPRDRSGHAPRAPSPGVHLEGRPPRAPRRASATARRCRSCAARPDRARKRTTAPLVPAVSHAPGRTF